MNDRVLVKDQTAGTENGIYYVSQVGDAGTPYILTRSDDFNSSEDITHGARTLIVEGTVNAGIPYVLTTNDPITLDTTSLTFSQWETGDSYSEGNGIQISGTTISVRLDTSGGLEFNGNEIRINVDATNGSTEINASNELQVKNYAVLTGTIAGTPSNEVLDSVAITSFRSVKWLVTLKNSTTGGFSTEIFAINLGTGTSVQHFQAGNIQVGTPPSGIQFSVDVSTGNMRLLLTSSTSGITYSVTRLALP